MDRTGGFRKITGQERVGDKTETLRIKTLPSTTAEIVAREGSRGYQLMNSERDKIHWRIYIV